MSADYGPQSKCAKLKVTMEALMADTPLLASQYTSLEENTLEDHDKFAAMVTLQQPTIQEAVNVAIFNGI